jgi:SAM-dependent methyltransferase
MSDNSKRVDSDADIRLLTDRFPRASAYNPAWVLASVSGGANPLWLTEWLAEALDLRPGLRVLDLGCGRATSSVFLHREFGVQVWAADLSYSASENLQRIRDAGVEGGVFSIQADARSLPFAAGFFDVVTAIDSFVYFGTDDLYLNYLARFLKPGGQVGIAGAGLMDEIEGRVPVHLGEWWAAERPYCLHSSAWWRHHWHRTGIVDVTTADTLPDGWRLWLDWLEIVAPENETEIRALGADAGRCLGYVRAVGRLRGDAKVFDPATPMPPQHMKKPLLRGED